VPPEDLFPHKHSTIMHAGRVLWKEERTRAGLAGTGERPRSLLRLPASVKMGMVDVMRSKQPGERAGRDPAPAARKPCTGFTKKERQGGTFL